MDALALLCNLYGDGPATLRRLREAGCSNLETLKSWSPEDLSVVLGSSPVAAKRFQREANLLAERAGPGFAEEHEVGAADESTDVLRPQKNPLIAKALATWRDHDRQEQPPALPVKRAAPQGVSLGATLAPQAIEGLDEESVRLLCEFGIDTLEALSRAELLEVCQSTGLPLTRLMRWQALARRRLAESPASPIEHSGGPFA